MANLHALLLPYLWSDLWYWGRAGAEDVELVEAASDLV
jgi:hypothetical protein